MTITIYHDVGLPPCVIVTNPDCWLVDPAYYVGWKDDREDHSQPNYPLPVVRKPNDHGPTICKGLLGECLGQCQWPHCN